MKKLLAFSLVGLLVFTGCGKKEENKGNEGNTGNTGNTGVVEKQPEVNTNPGIIEDDTLSAFVFSNKSMIYDGTQTEFNADVTNTSAQNIYIKQFNVYALDAEGNVIGTLIGYIGDNIAPGATRPITASASKDLTNAVDLRYEEIYQ